MLRKITIDNSVRYVSKDGHRQREQAPHIPKKRSLPNQRQLQILENNLKFFTKEEKSQQKYYKRRIPSF